MNEQEFKEILLDNCIDLTEDQVKQFAIYYETLIEWNEKVNLTAITDKDEVYLKHFYDSITPSFYEDFDQVKTICDIGAGAGFPSIPLKICFPHLDITIVDSLHKRISFLETLVEKLELTNVHLVHARAEDAGIDSNYREKYDLVTARAVARMSVLSEYCLPFCRVGGNFLALKGSNVERELLDAKKAIKTLGGKIFNQILFQLPKEESERSIVWIKKEKATPSKYPRKAGTPNRNPIK